MPALADHHSATTTKLLLLGDSGAGKTGALASLAASGYNLRILDFDNGVDILKGYLTGASPYTAKDPAAASRVHSLTCTDKRKLLGSSLVPVKAEAWEKACRALYEWKEPGVDGRPAVDLGKIETWGERDVLVIDSLSTAAESAMNYHLGLNGKLGATRTSNEARRDIGATQSLIRSLLQMLYSDSIKCNVIINAHITLVTESGMSPQSEDAKGESDTARGYPAAIGRALSPHIPRYFNSVLLLDVEGRGASAKHYLYTRSRGNVLVKTSAPLRVREKYELPWGLAEYFAAVRGEASPA
jgi:AAA domain